jgi:hypothetical protein
LLAALLGLLDQGAGLGELAVMLGQEFGGGDEYRAGQAPLTELAPAFEQVTACFQWQVASLAA